MRYLFFSVVLATWLAIVASAPTPFVNRAIGDRSVDDGAISVRSPDSNVDGLSRPVGSSHSTHGGTSGNVGRDGFDGIADFKALDGTFDTLGFGNVALSDQNGLVDDSALDRVLDGFDLFGSDDDEGGRKYPHEKRGSIEAEFKGPEFVVNDGFFGKGYKTIFGDEPAW
ncbi:hypothetical protein JCM10212_003137 [Sporobolomyces blumeae]